MTESKTPVEILSYMESKYDKVHIAPVEIMKYFDIPKDAKFSLRTLLLLSIFTIAIFGFGVKPDGIIKIPELKDIGFLSFTLIIIFGQGVIAWCAYSLYRSHIDNFLTHLKNEIPNIKKALKNSVDKYEKSVSGDLKIPDNVDKETKLKELFDHTLFMKAKLANHQNILKYSKWFYKRLNGIFPFFIAGVACLFVIIVWCYRGESIFELIF